MVSIAAFKSSAKMKAAFILVSNATPRKSTNLPNNQRFPSAKIITLGWNSRCSSLRLVRDTSRGMIVAIKQYNKNGIDKTHLLVKTTHSNVVALMYAWADNNVIFLAYELMTISLEQLYSVVNLKEPDVAFICSQVISTEMSRFKDI